MYYRSMDQHHRFTYPLFIVVGRHLNYSFTVIVFAVVKRIALLDVLVDEVFS